jgi:probable rRNA maturation factor
MIEVDVEAPAWSEALEDPAGSAHRAAEAALAAAARDGDVVVLLADDDALAALNAGFRDKRGPTNVLSFPAPETARPHLGDVAVAYGVCRREADEQGKRLEDHLMHLVAHGVLHLVGYDHQDDAEAEIMEALERKVLAGLGAPDPYAPPSGETPGHDHAR